MTKITPGTTTRKAAILANIMTMIEAYEDNVLNAIGTFIKTTLGLPVYLKDKPFIAPEDPYVTLRVITSNNSGGWGERYMFADEKFSYVMDNTYQIEVMIYRGRPIPALSYLLSAFMSFDELKYQTMYSKGISFLSSSGITEANTVLDGDKTQLRGRAVFTFNTRMITEDIESTEIERVSYSIHSYRDNYDDPKPVKYDNITFVHVTS